MTKSKAALQAKLTCDRCHRKGNEVAGIFPFTYVALFNDEHTMPCGEGSRMLCEDCFEYINDAMANLWPDKWTQ